jgi:hypothetical protein
MAVGLSGANLLRKWLDMLGGTAFTAPAATWAQLHTNAGDPGASGTANVSSVTTRSQMTWAAASGTSKAITSTFPTWATWAGTNNEVVSYISVWDASTAGNFLYSFALTTPKTMNTGDTATLSSHSFSMTPVAS